MKTKINPASGKWVKTVDSTTVVWLVIFFIGLFAFDSDLFGFEEPIINFPTSLEQPWDIISWIIWGIFAADVYFKYREIGNLKIFLKKHWFDILLLVPFFRIFRVLRLLRLLKTLKFARVGINFFKAYKKSKRFQN